MDSWLKALIATACVVVIAGGSQLMWSRYEIVRRRSLITQLRAMPPN